MKKLLIYLIFVVVLGFFTKFYNGWQAELVNNKSGGLFYVIFWMILVQIIFPKLAVWKNAFIVFMATSVIEFSQLLNVPFLVFIRRSFIGRTLIGTTFSWQDFLYYFVGAVIGFSLIRSRKETK